MAIWKIKQRDTRINLKQANVVIWSLFSIIIVNKDTILGDKTLLLYSFICLQTNTTRNYA